MPGPRGKSVILVSEGINESSRKEQLNGKLPMWFEVISKCLKVGELLPPAIAGSSQCPSVTAGGGKLGAICQSTPLHSVGKQIAWGECDTFIQLVTSSGQVSWSPPSITYPLLKNPNLVHFFLTFQENPFY